MALTVKKVARLVARGEPGMHLDEKGLYLAVESKRAASWAFRYQLSGRARLMGLGSARTLTLDEARKRAKDARVLLLDGIDPIEHRRSERATRAATAATVLTFKDATHKYVEQRDAEWSNAKHAIEYRGSLERYAFPVIGRMDVATIGVPHVLQVLEQKVAASQDSPAGTFWNVRTVTADRVRNRIENVLSWCAARGHRDRNLPNPAAWANNLEHVLPSPAKTARKQHHSAMSYAEVPALMDDLGKREGVGVKALMFTILTAARSNETLGAVWSEFDLANAVWTIPAERMKSRREHKVPLAPPAVALLNDLYREEGNPFVFIGARRQALSSKAMTETLRRAGRSETTHGFRSSFSDWCHERSNASNHVIEMCLAHSVGNAVERAYRRSDLFERRRKLMEAWASYVCTAPQAASGDKVVSLRAQT